MRKSKHIHGILFGLLIMSCCENDELDNDKTILKNELPEFSYSIVDTGVDEFYNAEDKIAVPSLGDDFYGQDASYMGNQPSYSDNMDGTVSDNITGLMWAQDMEDKVTFVRATSIAESSELGEYTDWRVPTIKELYSLILFTGQLSGMNADKLFIDTDYFIQPVGDVSAGEREIDAQSWSATEYVGKTMLNDQTVFGVNFIDGRIKGYPKSTPKNGEANELYLRLVRGNPEYGLNNFIDNNNGTISDLAMGLMWQQADNGKAYNWQEALEYAESLSLADLSDWRLPNAKELQSIVDYTRSPQTTNSAAIDPIFTMSEINYPDGSGGH